MLCALQHAYWWTAERLCVERGSAAHQEWAHASATLQSGMAASCVRRKVGTRLAKTAAGSKAQSSPTNKADVGQRTVD